MNRRPSWIAALILIVAGGYIVYKVAIYLDVQRAFREKQTRPMHPVTDDQSVTENVYIYAMRHETRISERQVNLVWFAVNPSTDEHWSCSFQGGFADFRVGDSVKIIREKNAEDTSDYSGYLIGSFGREKGKVTDAWILDLDDIDAITD